MLDYYIVKKVTRKTKACAKEFAGLGIEENTMRLFVDENSLFIKNRTRGIITEKYIATVS